FTVGGFGWIAKAEKMRYEFGCKLQFSLRCGVDHKRPWKCEAEVKMNLKRTDGTNSSYNMKRENFHERSIIFEPVDWRRGFPDKVTVEFDIHIISSFGGRFASFCSKPEIFNYQNQMSNVILKIGERKIHVSKEYLSVHSPFFTAMFFDDFVKDGGGGNRTERRRL
ncbi:hypothetical protein PMAYCL1PPCAC_04501, partial [Pristionchus mayeri]